MTASDDKQLSLDGMPPGGPISKAVHGPRAWHKVDHACRHCGGRVYVKLVGSREVESECAECGANTKGDHVTLCCCGADMGALGKVLRCYRNPAISKEVPFEVLVREHVEDPAPKEAKHSRRVDVKEVTATASRHVGIKGY